MLDTERTNFVVMCGLPGSGKSTIAKTLSNYVIISTDTIRAEFYGDESIQGDGAKVFMTAYKRIVENLRNQKNVVFDATNLHPKGRKALLKFVKSKVDVNCIVFAVEVDFQECLRRNAKRDRVVPEDVMHRMNRTYLYPTEKEGWDLIRIIQN